MTLDRIVCYAKYFRGVVHHSEGTLATYLYHPGDDHILAQAEIAKSGQMKFSLVTHPDLLAEARSIANGEHPTGDTDVRYIRDIAFDLDNYRRLCADTKTVMTLEGAIDSGIKAILASSNPPQRTSTEK